MMATAYNYPSSSHAQIGSFAPSKFRRQREVRTGQAVELVSSSNRLARIPSDSRIRFSEVECTEPRIWYLPIFRVRRCARPVFASHHHSPVLASTTLSSTPPLDWVSLRTPERLLAVVAVSSYGASRCVQTSFPSRWRRCRPELEHAVHTPVVLKRALDVLCMLI
ncbi:hypothetical protein EXIGLDRAFT_47972 [Exidia glandulosa HHB12029]|uniref:Uncharacterized protein n=1 Tax=Exidia glandulosa HHB12029 TaxID=1314781 RepID=A0A165P5V0_EXIGL|nr:hypothetical protein EXIGLDRAFT_47972 [Exidia glandulosa HHB12029]